MESALASLSQSGPILLFWVAAAGSVGTALAVIFQRNPVRCAIALVANFVLLALLYLLMNAQLLAALQILVYAGAIMVLFLFVIMLLNLGAEPVEQDPLVAQKPLAMALGAGLLIGIVAALLNWARSPAVGSRSLPLGVEVGQDQVYEIARQLFVKYVYPFELTSLLLLVGIIGTILLAKRRI